MLVATTKVCHGEWLPISHSDVITKEVSYCPACQKLPYDDGGYGAQVTDTMQWPTEMRRKTKVVTCFVAS